MAKGKIAFIPNAGQVRQEIDYYALGAGCGIHFTEEGVMFCFSQKTSTANRLKKKRETIRERMAAKAGQEKVKGYAIRLRFLGANSGVKPEGRQPALGTVNYLKGSDPAKWKTDLATYEEIVYRELWQGIDMVFRAGHGGLKYEFVVQPQSLA